MKVKSIELINLKSYKSSTLQLSENINLLVGANNSGKSTIIRALLNLQYRSFDKKDVRSSELYSKIFTKIVNINESDNYRFYNPNFPNELGTSNAYTILWHSSRHIPTEEQNFYYDSSLTETRLDYNQVKTTDNNNNEISLKAFARFSDYENQNNFIYPFLARRKTEYYDNHNMNEKEIFKVGDSLRNLAGKVQKISNPSHPMNAEFNNLCVDILGFKIGIIPVGENNNGLEVGIYSDSTSMISLRSMGDGVANIVGFIVILLTENNKLFLIEELENDIHPRALKKLLTLIVNKSSQNQFVISTHSHIVLKYLGVVSNSKIFYTDWSSTDGKENTPTSTITEIENKPEKRIEILEKLGYDFFDFDLHEAYLILEESSAESVIRDFLIPSFVPKLYNRIRTIAAKGVDDLRRRVIDFNRLFVFIHTSPVYYKKAWIIADGDESGKECIKDLKNQFKSWPENHFINFSSEDFEKYYPLKFKNEVESISSMKHGNAKQIAKTELLNEVMNWAFKNRDEATKAFEISAKEVIEILHLIEKSLSEKT